MFGRYKQIRVGSEVIVIDKSSFRRANAAEARKTLDTVRASALAAGVGLLISGLMMEKPEQNVAHPVANTSQYEVQSETLRHDMLFQQSQSMTIPVSLPARETWTDLEYSDIVLPHAPIQAHDRLFVEALENGRLDDLIEFAGSNIGSEAFHVALDIIRKEANADQLEAAVYVTEDKIRFTQMDVDQALASNLAEQYIAVASSQQLFRTAYGLINNESPLFKGHHREAIIQSLAFEAPVDQLVQLARMPWVIESGSGSFVANQIINKGSPSAILEVVEQDWLLTTEQMQTAQARLEHYGTPRDMINFAQRMLSHPERSMHLDPVNLQVAMMEKADISAVIELAAIQQWILPSDMLGDISEKVAQHGQPSDILDWVSKIDSVDHSIIASRAQELDQSGSHAGGLSKAIEEVLLAKQNRADDLESEAMLDKLFDDLTRNTGQAEQNSRSRFTM